MTGAGSKHLDLEPRCGACGDVVFEHERVIALYGNAGPYPNGYLSDTRPFPYPLVHYTHAKVDNTQQLCTRPGCDLNQLPGMQHSTPEAVTVHHDCFSIFSQQYTPTLSSVQAEQRLFTTGLYRNPWPRAQPLSLTDGYYMSRSALGKIASVSGLPQLADYPAELLEMIRQYSPHSLFWRAISVIALAERLSITLPEPLLVVPIYEIDRWERGGQLERWIPPDDLPATSSKLNDLTLETSTSSRRAVVRLTIDAEGIKKIELLPDRPPYIRERTESLAFMIEELAALKGVKACFMDGLVQLYSNSGYPSLRIWDTPSPPSLSQCTIFSDKKRPWRHFRTVELDSTTGLTFFYWQGSLIGIHPHRANDSCASSSYERLSRRQPPAWIYYPVSPLDKISIFGARPVDVGVNILIRSRLSGDVVIGSWGRGTAADSWRRKEPTTLIYGEPPDGCPIPYLGTYCRTLPNKQQQQQYESSLVCSSTVPPDPRAKYKLDMPFTSFTRHVPRLPIQLGTLLYFSVAPLSNIASAQVFYSPDTPSPHSSPSPPSPDLFTTTSSSSSSPLNPPPTPSSDHTTCQGLILHYRNGGSRSLGQVRLHVDDSFTVHNPTHAYSVAHGIKGRVRAWIKFVSDPEETNQLAAGETCWPLSRGGALRFWFNEVETHIGFRHDD